MDPVTFIDGNTPTYPVSGRGWSPWNDDVAKALKAIVDDTSEQVSITQIDLSKVLLYDGASKLERALKALKYLAKEDKVR